MSNSSAPDPPCEPEPESANLMRGIRILDLFLATQRKLVGDKVMPLVGINLTGKEAFTIGSTGAVIEFPVGDSLECLVVSGLNLGNDMYTVPLKGTISGKCYQTGRTQVINSIDEEEESFSTKNARIFGIQSIICTPLEHHGKCMGVLSLYSPSIDAFPVETVQSIKVMASVIAVLLDTHVSVNDEDSASDTQ